MQRGEDALTKSRTPLPLSPSHPLELLHQLLLQLLIPLPCLLHLLHPQSRDHHQPDRLDRRLAFAEGDIRRDAHLLQQPKIGLVAIER